MEPYASWCLQNIQPHVLPWAKLIHSTTLSAFNIHFILPSYQRRTLASGLFPSSLSTIFFYEFQISPVLASSHPSWWGIQILKLLTMQFSPFCCCHLPLDLNVLFSTTSLNTFRACSFLDVRDQASGPYTTLTETRTIVGVFYSTVVLKTGRQNILDRAIADISCIRAAANFFMHEIWLLNVLQNTLPRFQRAYYVLM